MLLVYICFAFYLVTSGLVVTGMFREQGHNKILALATATTAIVLHTFILKSTILIEPGQNMSMLNVASLIGWIISITMLCASFKVPNTILLPVVYGFTAILVMLSQTMPSAHVIQMSVQPSLIIHVSLALFAYACLGIAFLYALQLFYINLRLKEKNASMLHSSLPPLMAVEHILFKLLLIGTALLTLSLISGFVFLDDMFTKEQAHKTVLSLIAWAIYATIVLGHAKFGWRGKPVIMSTIIGSVLLTLAYFGSRFVREVLLNS
ncbi:cytochrome c biogenesis protein CcsA [Paraglaciecola aquimarina]|uniref:Cytochrome c biogenesis protein CcsA n=1 Tax=Paraglaciecola algarum TaxID=3050085 RepID=A0ABS9DE79_9ALTE|nr:cytochrome c biogenesis protein CcsA [Paraglaciecola sp. G1-23]MCF2950347.1 cytochrome c biogenesis protein CcsA [Paraglaciecola sp. G1-23]